MEKDMRASATLRGHKIRFDQEAWKWVYEDNGLPTDVNYKTRGCACCGGAPTDADHDACLGELPGGVIGACCGHGNAEEAYVYLDGGLCIRGEDAVTMQAILKKYRR